ncbi:hypothetical protein [Nostoc sp.]|uniref:hypothetical protein n=1 Tax=Nostoc sp. TaxID=1180 RepID=UPI002FFC4D12
MLSENIVKLKQKINSLGASYPLDEVKPDFVDKVQLESNNDDYFRCIFKKMSGLINKCTIRIGNYKSITELKSEDYERINELKNLYSEAYIYSKLKSWLAIEKVPETSQRTPDFKVIFRGSPIYIEIKSLNMADGQLKHIEIMDKVSNMKIDLETQKKSNKAITISETIIQPYYKSGNPYNAKSTKMMIETLIYKITNNLKQEQFNQGDTLLLVDIATQLPVPHPESAIRENYEIHSNKVSGVLWHTAFGIMNSTIYPFPALEDDSETEYLSSEGILNTHPYIKGLIFHIDENFYALAKSADENLRAIELISYLCPKTTVLSLHSQ